MDGSIILREIDPVRDTRWRAFVERTGASSLFHSPEWLLALRRTYGYRPVAFTDAAVGQPLQNGLLFCRVHSWLTGRRLVSVPFSDHCAPLVDDPVRLTAMLGVLARQEARATRYIEIRPIEAGTLPDGYVAAERFVWHTIDLRPDLDAIYGRMHRNHTRRAIRKARRVGVVIEAGRSAEMIRNFYALHTLTRRRHGAPVQPFCWFQNLAETLGNRLTIYRARYEGRPVAALLIIRHKRTVVYKYGCSDITYKSTGATPALFWQAIVDARSVGCNEMDLGRSDLDHAGLIAFKRHIGGEPVEMAYYRHAGTASAPAAVRWLGTVQRALLRTPEIVQDRAGGVLYRHFG